MSSYGKQILRTIEDTCETALVGAGFKRLRRGTIVWEFSDKFWGWIGLNRGIHGDLVRINPFIGIHAVDVMKLCAQLDRKKYAKGMYATYAVHLGEVAPDESVFEFHREEDVHSEANRLGETIAGAGLGYMQSIASYEALLPLIETRMSMLGGYPERYVVTLYLSGRRALARDFAARVLAQESGLAWLVNESFMTFCSNFMTFTDVAQSSD